MDAETRRLVKHQVDTARRRKLGLPDVAMHRAPAVRGSTARRWTEPEIRAAVLRATGGKRVRPLDYKAIRRGVDPHDLPHYDTVKARCPDLFD